MYDIMKIMQNGFIPFSANGIPVNWITEQSKLSILSYYETALQQSVCSLSFWYRFDRMKKELSAYQTLKKNMIEWNSKSMIQIEERWKVYNLTFNHGFQVDLHFNYLLWNSVQLIA